MSRRTSAARTDPLEEALAQALKQAGIAFVRERGGLIPVGLDFYLPDHDLYIEVKRFHSDRIGPQMARAANVIAIQGLDAVRWFCGQLTRK